MNILQSDELKNWKLNIQVSDTKQISSYIMESINNIDFTAFEVFPTNRIIPAGYVDSPERGDGLNTIGELFEYSDEDAKNQVFTNYSYSVDVPENDTVNLQMHVFVKNQENINIIIDWGDGIISSLASCPLYVYGKEDQPEEIVNLSALNYFHDYIESDGYSAVGISHKYEENAINKKHIVKVYGNNYGMIRTYSTNTAKSIVSRFMQYDLPIASCVKNVSSFARQSYTLLNVNIPYQFKNNIIHWQIICADCPNLKNTIIDSTVISQPYWQLAKLFINCSNMESCTFKIPTNAMGVKPEDIISIFSGCSSLTSNVEDLLPVQGFSTRKVNVKDMFKDCNKMTGIVPADILWKDTNKIWLNTNNAFSGCSDDIRNQVPISWGGTQEENIDYYKLNDTSYLIKQRTTGMINIVDLSHENIIKFKFIIPSDNYEIMIKTLTKLSSKPNAVIDWGDGKVDLITSSMTDYKHTYYTAGDYTVQIIDNFSTICFSDKTLSNISTTSCLSEIDLSEAENMKIVNYNFVGVCGNLKSVKGDANKLQMSGKTQIFSTITNPTAAGLLPLGSLSAFNTIENMTEINGGMFQRQQIYDISDISTHTELTAIMGSSFYSTNQAKSLNSLSSCVNLKVIDAKAFSYAGNSITLPKSIETIDSTAFQSMNNKTKITASFIGKTEDEIKSIKDKNGVNSYPFGFVTGSTINCCDDEGAIISTFTVDSITP